MPIFNRKLLGMAIANMPEIPNLAEKRAALRNWKQAIESGALYFNSAREEHEIFARFYEKYAHMRRMLFAHLKHNNPFPLLETASSEQTAAHELLLLEKAQKLLDRCIFVFFCEDSGELLPEKTFRTLARRAQETLALAQFGEQKIWIELKALFRALDDGLKTHNIPGFNGELFKPDAALDALRIEDAILLQLAELAEYDFRSDLNVNILGHIFEQSLPDLEELRAEIRGEPRDAKPGKRKKEGIFYTPEYITRYIVEQAVGGWLADRWRELGGGALPELTAEDEAWLASSNRNAPSARIAQRIACYEAYWERVRRVTILDPAC